MFQIAGTTIIQSTSPCNYREIDLVNKWNTRQFDRSEFGNVFSLLWSEILHSHIVCAKFEANELWFVRDSSS